jgi:signal transduction histidine kinase
MSARTVLSFSRDLEFATETELAKRMGVPRADWLRAVLKEVVDNALDACEEAGVDPEITVTIDGLRLTVADNGPGMSPELIERLCERSERTSTREAYAAPDRGAQGNALQTIMALGFGFGHETSHNRQRRRQPSDRAPGEPAGRPDRARPGRHADADRSGHDH